MLAAVSRTSGDIVTVTRAGLMTLHTVNLDKVLDKKVEPRVTALAWSKCEEGAPY